MSFFDGRVETNIRARYWISGSKAYIYPLAGDLSGKKDDFDLDVVMSTVSGQQFEPLIMYVIPFSFLKCLKGNAVPVELRAHSHRLCLLPFKLASASLQSGINGQGL